MQNQTITKTLAIPEPIAKAIEEIAKQERRSFTQQVGIILENALKHQSQEKTETFDGQPAA